MGDKTDKQYLKTTKMLRNFYRPLKIIKIKADIRFMHIV